MATKRKKTEPPRAPRGSIETSQLVRMSEELAEAMAAEAKRQGISIAQAWRDAGRDWVLRRKFIRSQ